MDITVRKNDNFVVICDKIILKNPFSFPPIQIAGEDRLDLLIMKKKSFFKNFSKLFFECSYV